MYTKDELEFAAHMTHDPSVKRAFEASILLTVRDTKATVENVKDLINFFKKLNAPENGSKEFMKTVIKGLEKDILELLEVNKKKPVLIDIGQLTDNELLILSNFTQEPMEKWLSDLQYGSERRGLQITIHRAGEKFTAHFVHLIIQNGTWAQLPIECRSDLNITTSDYIIGEGYTTYQRQIAL